MFLAYYREDAWPCTPQVWLRFKNAETQFVAEGLAAFFAKLDYPSSYKVLVMALPSA